MICLETLNDPLEGITLMVQAHQIFFAPVTFPRGAVLGVFNCFTLNIFTGVLGINLRVDSLKNPFYTISRSAGSHGGLRCFGAPF